MIRLLKRLSARRQSKHVDPFTADELDRMRRKVWRLIQAAKP